MHRLINNRVETLTMDTRVFDDEIQHILKNDSHVLGRWIVKTQDTATRKALILLGWTPPGEPTDRCIFEDGCEAMSTGYCAMSHCPKFQRRY